MRIAFVSFNGVTLLDFAGLFDPVSRLKTMGFCNDIEYEVCSQGDLIQTFEGVTIIPDNICDNLSSYDLIIIPGGNGIVDLMKNSGFLAWLHTISGSALIAAVCGGSLLAGSAGFLKDKKATTHPDLLHILTRFCRETSTERIVEDGRIITAGGVTSAIDLGLYLCEKIAGAEVRKKIQKQMDYPYYPRNLSALKPKMPLP